MEIYLLREQKEVGPYGAEDVRSWLDQGQVSASELAWAPGLESWVPLQSILDPQLAPEPELQVTPEPQPAAPEPAAPKPILKPLPRANARQRAFLSYMGVSFVPEITADDAERLTREAGEDPKLAARKARWEDDRLDLHPELFVEELKERRANRPSYFHKLVQTEGGDCFSGVTKAHCQVLVGYLDVKFPRWDANLRDAAWHYFFPAIAEKFPQLVHKEWRPKLKFKEGPIVAPELLEPQERVRSAAENARRGRIISRSVAGVAILALVGAAFGAMRSPSLAGSLKAKVSSFGTDLMAIVRGDDPAEEHPRPIPKKVVVNEGPAAKTPDASTPEPTAASGEAPKIAATTEPAAPATQPRTPEKKPAMTAEMKPAMTGEMKPADMAMAAEMKPEMKPDMAADGAAPMKPTEGLFNPNANTPPAVAAVPGGISPPRAETRLTQPVQVPTKFGVVTINPGTSLKIVSREGEWLTLNYMSQAIRVPVNSTDFTP